MLTHGDWYGAD